FNVNYTWSRAFDQVDQDSDNIHNPTNMRDDWAPAGYDVTHSLSIDYVYQIPNAKGMFDNRFGRALMNGWEISGITHYQSGFPFSITGNGNLQGIDAGTQFVD